MMRYPRLPRAPLTLVALAVVTLVTAGAALAVRPASGPAGPDTTAQSAAAQSAAGQAARPAVSAQPHLTANANAACNKPQKKGFARCLAVVRTPSSGVITPLASAPPATALGPADIQAAYNLPAGAGGGQTVALVDAYGDSHAEDDLAVFRAQYGLPPCTTANGCFRKVDQTGGTNYPNDDPGWGLETALDLDAVSAACPACNILLVEANDPGLDSLGAAVDTAVSLGAKFVSNSYGVPGEDPSELSYEQHYDHPGVAVLASSGDTGNVTSWPSTSPKVVSVGGTLLSRDSSVTRGWTETAWGSSAGGQGGGSGCSPYEPHPDYQDGIDTNCPTNRASADIAADADPASGLATYDTLGSGGWLQVGGTSLASPLVAAMYALAGSPLPGSYPVSYPYHDRQPADHLFDITQGVNGGCGNVLCQAGPGWDGPTGLGTPNGVAALSSGPHGTLAGRITDQATGQPIAGATVAASPGNYAARTDANGGYRLDIQAGTYDLTVKAYGYQVVTRNGVSISVDQTMTQNFAITAAPSAVLSGTVTDGSGHGWPLHARIGISGYPDGGVYTDPDTGRYRVTLPQGDYTLDISTDVPGYNAVSQQITVGSSNVTSDISLTADLAACTAPGYGWNGSTTEFTGWAAATAREGWAITGSKSGWRFDNPGDRPPPQIPPGFQAGGDDNFAVADSGASGGQVDTVLTSPAIDLSGQSAPQLQFDTGYYAASGQRASVELSVNSGQTWTGIWQQSTANSVGHVTVAVPTAANRSDVRVRFHYTGRSGWYWAVDDVFLGTRNCVAQHGGLIVGVVTDQATGKPINGAQMARVQDPRPATWPAGIATGTADPALPGGYYWLFSPAGSQQLTASASGYTTDTSTVAVTADQIVRHDIALTAHSS